MFMPPLALRQICLFVSKQPELPKESKTKLMAACMLILQSAQIAFFSERYDAPRHGHLGCLQYVYLNPFYNLCAPFELEP